MGCSGCGMFGIWDVGCGMFAGIWDVHLQNATLLNTAKLHNVSKLLHCLVISQSTNSTLNESLNLIIYLCL